MPEVPAFALALIALVTGTIIGWFVQRTMISIQRNGLWPDTPDWKKQSLSGTGSIAAFIAGLWVLQGAETFNAWDLVWKLWLYQTVAAYGGATALDVIVRFLGKGKP